MFISILNDAFLSDSPYFIAITLSNPNTPNLRAGDTDPAVPDALIRELQWYHENAINLPSTKNKQTILMNQLAANMEAMRQGGKKAWCDNQHFEAINPTHVEFQCQEALGKKGTLSVRECKEASYLFIGAVYAPNIEKNKPIVFKYGTSKHAIILI